jgi:hypothetical protein
MEKTNSKKSKLRLFVINYGLTTTEQSYRGTALVKAATTSQAERTFLNQSNFNGYQSKIKISRIEEVFLTPETALISEEYVKAGFNNEA